MPSIDLHSHLLHPIPYSFCETRRRACQKRRFQIPRFPPSNDLWNEFSANIFVDTVSKVFEFVYVPLSEHYETQRRELIYEGIGIRSPIVWLD